MALTHPIDRTSPAHETHDSFLHVVARDFQWALRGVCLLLLIATVVFMATFWYVAIATVILLLLAYIALIVTDGIEARTDHRPHDTVSTGAVSAAGSAIPADEARDPDTLRRQEKTVAIERRLTRISMEVLGGTIVLAVALAAVAFDWKVLPIAGLVIVGYIILVTAPVWGAWMESDVQDEVVKRRVD